jgi:hypothetical protein
MLSGRSGKTQSDQTAADIRVLIEASGLTVRDWRPASGDGPGNLHVGVQGRDKQGELLGLRPADVIAAVWTFPATSVPTAAGMDLKGPYVQGRPGNRFIYVSWGTVDDGVFTMRMRAKLMLDAVDPATWLAARTDGRLIARLSLTDDNGNPRCAAIRPPLIEWTANSAG